MLPGRIVTEDYITKLVCGICNITGADPKFDKEGGGGGGGGGVDVILKNDTVTLMAPLTISENTTRGRQKKTKNRGP